MTIFPYKRVKVTEGLYIKRSEHFFYSDFGVRDTATHGHSGIATSAPVCPVQAS